MKNFQKYIAILSMLVVGLNFTSILHHNFLSAHVNLTAFAEGEDEPEEAEEPTVSEIEGCEITEDDGTTRLCTEEEYREMIVELQEFAIADAEAEQQGVYIGSLEDFSICLPNGVGDSSNPVCNTKLETENRAFNRLLNSIANNEIRTVLEEPLGNDNIYKRARVCRTKFLKDRFGRLQPVGISDTNKYYTQNAEEISDSTDDPDTETFFHGKEFLITTGQCEEFFVKECQPQNNRQSTIGAGNPLPIQVTCDQVQVLFATSGSDLVKSYVGLIYRWAAGIIGVISVLVILIQGIRMSQSGGDQGKVDAAKTAIIQSLTALALLFLAGILLSSINPNFFTQRDLQSNPAVEEAEEATGSDTDES